jgi:hypothetical protein
MKNALFALLVGIASVQGTTTPALAESETTPDANGWLGRETEKTPFGNFDFNNGYPSPEAATRLLDQLKLNRAVTEAIRWSVLPKLSLSR